jgi:hypothetical protein
MARRLPSSAEKKRGTPQPLFGDNKWSWAARKASSLPRVPPSLGRPGEEAAPAPPDLRQRWEVAGGAGGLSLTTATPLRILPRKNLEHLFAVVVGPLVLVNARADRSNSPLPTSATPIRRLSRQIYLEERVSQPARSDHRASPRVVAPPRASATTPADLVASRGRARAADDEGRPELMAAGQGEGGRAHASGAAEVARRSRRGPRKREERGGPLVCSGT